MAVAVEKLVLELAALLEGRVLLLVGVDVFAAGDEELDARGDALVGARVEEGFGKRREAFGVVGYEGRDGALWLDVG